MLKKLSLCAAFLLAATFALGQGSVYTDIVFNRFGEPMAGAVIYICLSDPGATPQIPCNDLATVYTDLTLGTPVNQSTTPLTTDGYGNVVTGTKQGVYGVPGIYYMEVSGYAITAFSKIIAIPGTGGGGGGGGGTPNFVTKTLLSGVFGDSVGFDNGTDAVRWPNGISFESSGGKLKCTIGTTGTVTNQLVKVIQESGAAVCVNATTADTINILGVCTEGCGAVGGTARITVIGQAACVSDNQTVIGDVLTPSAITNGNCHDAGATEVPIIQNLGRVLTLNTGTGTLASANFGLPDSIGQPSTGNGSVSNCGTVGAIGRYPAAGTTIGCDPLFTSDGAGSTTAISHTTAGAGAGFLYFTQSTTPTLTPANSVMLFAPASIASFFKLKLPAALGTAAQCVTLSGVSGDTGTLAFAACGTGSVSSVGLTVNGTSPSGIFTVTGSPVTTSGTLNFNLAGTSGGIPYFSSATVLSSSGALTANLPVFGGGAGASPIVGTRTGNTTQVATWTGATTASKCVHTDASGNLTVTSDDCGTGGGADTFLFDQCSAAQTTNPGNSFWTVAGLTNWDFGHWEFTKNTTADVFCSIKIPSTTSGTPHIVFDLMANDNTAGHTASFGIADAITSSLNPQVGSLTASSACTFTTTATAYAVTTCSIVPAATIVAGQVLVVKIEQATGGANTANVLMYPPKYKIN